jgi:hypothetical protein
MAKQVTYGQDTLIIGPGATEAKAWKVAREISAKRKNWHSVYYHRYGEWHRVTCYEGRDQGQVLRTGEHAWSARETVEQRAARLVSKR